MTGCQSWLLFNGIPGMVSVCNAGPFEVKLKYENKKVNYIENISLNDAYGT